ncbi:MAG: hypothetical protein GY795_30070 [Desulfobacterales bacterium]|nr:hypothetical protein [Desulfobacterales bacterium]
MFFWKKSRRHTKRYSVSWDALLEVRFPDFQDNVKVKVANVSGTGAYIHSNQIFFNNCHLISLEQKPDLNLKVFSPNGLFESIIEIQWYNWSVKQNIYEIGVEFIYLLKEHRDIIDKVMHSLHKKEKKEFQFGPFFLSRNVHVQA